MRNPNPWPKRLLLAEDSPENGRRLIEWLARLDGIKIVAWAHAGAAALPVIEGRAPRCAVLDLQMPEMSGLEVLAAIRNLARSCLVIILTVQNGAEFRARCLEAGADFFVDKAHDVERVVQIVREFLGGRVLTGGSSAVDKFTFSLYVTGNTPRTDRAIRNLQRICEEELRGRYRIVVIDILERPQLAEDEKILATPTLIKQLPLPLRRIIGDLSDVQKVLLGLDIQPAAQQRTRGAC